jgi:tripartite ATP-independent transporter DctM subunit
VSSSSLIKEASLTGPFAKLASGLEKFVATVVEWVAACLVLACIGILFAGVVGRYLFNSPLVWSDELASILFLWLAMVGSVIALKRGEHMRMTACISRLGDQGKRYFESLGILACFFYLAIIIRPAYHFALDELIVTTPSLEVSNLWRAAALPSGIILMMFFCLFRLARIATFKIAIVSTITLLVGFVLFYLCAPMFATLGKYNLLIFFVGVAGFSILAGVPIAFAFGLGTVAYLGFSTHMPLSDVIDRMDKAMSHMVLLAVPLFVFLGLLMEMTGMARAMIAFLASMLGHVRGGLSYVLVGAMYLVSGISGSKAADMAAIAPALFPEMKKTTPPGELVALLAATGAQTETIPPSLVLITIGSVTGVSIAALFTGGMLPALILALILCILVWWRNRHVQIVKTERVKPIEVFKLCLVAFPALALPFVIRAAVVEGIATATEVSTIGIVYGLICGLLIYRQFDVKRIVPMLIDTASLSGAILLIIGAATGMAWGLTQSGFSQVVAQIMTDLNGGPNLFLFISIIVFIILGSVLEGIPAIVLFGPLLFPVARQLGINEVHYSMVVILSMGIGLFAPPLGVGYYAACAIGKVNPDEGVKPIIGYLIALVIGTVIIAFVPWLSTGFLSQ